MFEQRQNCQEVAFTRAGSEGTLFLLLVFAWFCVSSPPRNSVAHVQPPVLEGGGESEVLVAMRFKIDPDLYRMGY